MSFLALNADVLSHCLKNKYIHLDINTFVFQIVQETGLTISKHSNNIKNKAIARDAEKQIAFFTGPLTLKSIWHGSHSLAVLKAEITLNVIQSEVMADLATIFKLWALEVLQTILLPVFQL